MLFSFSHTFFFVFSTFFSSFFLVFLLLRSHSPFQSEIHTIPRAVEALLIIMDQRNITSEEERDQELEICLQPKHHVLRECTSEERLSVVRIIKESENIHQKEYAVRRIFFFKIFKSQFVSYISCLFFLMNCI